MTFEEAEKTLREEYEKAKKIEWVHSPVAYALYKTWRKADEDDRKDIGKNHGHTVRGLHIL